MFKNMALGKKIGMGFGVMILFLCGVGVTCYVSMGTATNSIDDITTQLDIAKEVNTVLTDAQDAQAAALRFMIHDDDRYYEHIETESKAAIECAMKAKSLMKSAENRAVADGVIEQVNAYLAANAEWKELQEQRRDGERVRAEAAGVVLDNIKDLLGA